MFVCSLMCVCVCVFVWMALAMQVYTHSFLTGDTILIPENTIPIDRSNCTSLVLPTPAATPTTSTATPTPPPSSTCLALMQIQFQAGSTCHTSPSCGSLLCDVFIARANITILPCHTPPAVAVKVVQSSDGSVLLDDVLTRSRLENVTLGRTTLFRLNVTIKHADDALILKVCRLLGFPLVAVDFPLFWTPCEIWATPDFDYIICTYIQ